MAEWPEASRSCRLAPSAMLASPPIVPSLPRAEPSARDRRMANLCLALLVAMGAAAVVGVMGSLYLADRHPLLLVALSPLPRHLLLVAPTVDPVAFVLVATVRSLSFFLVCFHLGRTLGPSALSWLEGRAPRMGRLVRGIEHAFQRASYPVVLALVGPTVSVIAGAAGMRAFVFAALATLALVARLALILEVGDWLRGPLDALRTLVGTYWLPGTLVLVLGIALSRWRGRAGDAVRTRPVGPSRRLPESRGEDERSP